MTVPNQRDPDLTQVVKGLMVGLADLKANVISRWGRIPHVATDPTSLADGMVWVRSDTDALRWRANGTTMSAAAGRMGGVAVAVDQAGITVEADMTSYTITFTAVAGRRYTAWYTFGANQLTAGAANQIFRIYSDGVSLGIIENATAVAVAARMVSGFWEIGTLTAASHTIKLTASTTAGTLTIPNLSLVNGRFAIYDVGT